MNGPDQLSQRNKYRLKALWYSLIPGDQDLRSGIACIIVIVPDTPLSTTIGSFSRLSIKLCRKAGKNYKYEECKEDRFFHFIRLVRNLKFHFNHDPSNG
jgi:hypothetical protein